MLNTDDLEYESVYGEEEEDYDEVPDSSEQPVMGGELPCACLAPRMEPPGATVGLLGLRWGDASTSRLAVVPRALWLGVFGICSPLAGTQAGCMFPITSLCHADLTLHPPHRSHHRQ